MKWDKREMRLLLGVITTPKLWLWGKVNTQWDKTLRATLDTGHVPQKRYGDYTLHGVEVSERGAYENITKPHNTLYPSRRTALLFRLTFKHAILQDREKAIDTVCNKLIVGVDDKDAPEQPEATMGLAQKTFNRPSPFNTPYPMAPDPLAQGVQNPRSLNTPTPWAQEIQNLRSLQHSNQPLSEIEEQTTAMRAKYKSLLGIMEAQNILMSNKEKVNK